MKILYLLRYYPTLTESFIYEEIRSLQKYQGANIEVFALSKREDGHHQTRLPNVPVHYIPKSRWRRMLGAKTTGMHWLTQHQRPKDVCKIPWLLKRIESFDHIHVHFAGEAAEVAHALWIDKRIPYSLHVHAVDLFCPRASLPDLISGAKHVITISQYNRQRLQHFGCDAKVVYSGIDVDFWTSKRPISKNQAIFVGRNREKKGLSQLIEVWKTISQEYILHVVSDVTGTAENIRFHGLCSPERVRSLIDKSRFLVMPSRVAPNGDMDGIPVVLLEALAMNRAVITTAVSGIPELISAREGWLISPDRPKQLRHAIVEAFQEERGLKNRETLLAKNLSNRDQSAQIWAFFNKV
ncbi:MAG: glycosyltransferase family 4 protein [Myxococcota bacterium]|nr:glycosyltransferase family 4 protein [Myxococcota bacterium]